MTEESTLHQGGRNRPPTCTIRLRFKKSMSRTCTGSLAHRSKPHVKWRCFRKPTEAISQQTEVTGNETPWAPACLGPMFTLGCMHTRTYKLTVMILEQQAPPGAPFHVHVTKTDTEGNSRDFEKNVVVQSFSSTLHTSGSEFKSMLGILYHDPTLDEYVRVEILPFDAQGFPISAHPCTLQSTCQLARCWPSQIKKYKYYCVPCTHSSGRT